MNKKKIDLKITTMIMRTHVFEDNYFIKRYSRVPNASVKHTINVHMENSI